jgi:ATP-binding cassette subfamily B multidrug efflux pump
MIRALRYLTTKEKWQCVFVLFFVVVQVWLDLTLPDYMAEITTLAETSGSTVGQILLAGLMMVLCALGSMAAAMASAYFGNKVAAGLATTLRGQVFEHAVRLSKADVDEIGSASLVNRCTNDITQIQNLVSMGLSAILKAPIMVVWAIIKIIGYGWQWSLATVVSAVTLCLALGVTMSIAVPRFQKIQGLTDTINRLTQEHLQGIRSIRAYNAENYEKTRFADANTNITRTNTVANQATAVITPLLTLESSALTLAIYWIGAYMIRSAGKSTGLTLFSEMVVFSNYAIQIIMAFMLLSIVFILYPRAQVSAGRVLEVIDRTPRLLDGPGVGETAQKGTVEFRHVDFSYPGDGARVLHDVSFSAGQGQTVAFIGATGSGKTTIAQLIDRLYDASGGTVLVDGHDVRDYRLSELHERIGYVPQTATLFAGTVAGNVSYGDAGHEITREDVADALDITQSASFVTQMDGSYDASIEQGGRNVSGGQRQRLAMARAIARRPEILVFDDSFSALDFATDRALRGQLREKCADTTKIIVAQRVGTIRDADLIVVLDDGRVAGKGTHDQLMRTCPVYQQIVSSQMGQSQTGDSKTGDSKIKSFQMDRSQTRQKEADK